MQESITKQPSPTKQVAKNEDDFLSSPLFENLRKLLTIVDELRDVGLQEYINLPRIAVVGSQSSGKSSLLENIVGLDFLPRGEGLVTRRPLEMRLVHSPNVDKTYGVFQELQNEKFYNFDKVTEKINELTDKVAGKKKGIVKEAIVLTIYSRDCPDLTLIDLPGITRVPLANSDHPNNIEEVTKNIVYHYIKDERTIILVVIPANQDISVSDGLQMARQLDKDGKRTIGVITKLDIMDRGTNAKKMLLGQEVALRLGYVAVKNRSQMDINEKMKVKKALLDEQLYFSQHPVYSTMNPSLLGTKSLVQKLSTIMFNHIKVYLPQIIKEIQAKIKECEEKLRDLGPALPREMKQKMHLLWNMITDYTENYKNSIRGKYDGKRQANINQELSGGAIIKMIFTELYDEFSQRDYNATKDYTDKDIEKAIILHQGPSIPGFPSIDSFLYLIQPKLAQLKEPAFDTLYNVHTYLENLSNKLIEKLFGRFPEVIDSISDIANRVLSEERDKAKLVVQNIIESELGYLFTNDYNYLMSRSNLIPQQQQNNQPFDSHKAFLNELRQRIDQYFSLVLRNCRDSVPKAIGYFLVKSSQDKMQYTLYTEVMKNVEILNHLGEPPHIAQERDTINKILDVLKKATKVLKRDPDLSSINEKYSTS